MGIILEYQYFPPVILFKALQEDSYLKLEQYENFQKMSFRNRMVIAGGNGKVSLTVPVRGGRNLNCLTSQVLIDDRTDWQSSHWKTLTSCYNKSPCFEYYRDELEAIYKTEYERLVDWNLSCLEWTTEKLGLNISVSLTEVWKDAYDLNEWSDWRGRLLPRSIEAFDPDPPKYRQVFEERTGFIPHLSILDLLFCEGKNAPGILAGG